MTTTSSSTTRTSAGRSFGAFALAAVAAAAGSAIANTVIALVARAAGASSDFQPLWPTSYLPLTVLGVLAGTIGWQIVRRRAKKPAAVLRVLAPTVVVLSLIPDFAVGAADSSPGVSWGAVAALILMHLATAAVAILSYRRLLPLN